MTDTQSAGKNSGHSTPPNAPRTFSPLARHLTLLVLIKTVLLGLLWYFLIAPQHQTVDSTALGRHLVAGDVSLSKPTTAREVLRD